jgi:hypothetical protein
MQTLMENAPMTTRSQGVLVITADGEVMAFRDAGIAASYVEAVDVRDGEYEASLTIGGDPVPRHCPRTWRSPRSTSCMR